MISRHFDIETPDGKCDCFSAVPGDGRAYPVAIVLMDAFGPRKYLYALCETLAARGYFVLLPNLFYRMRRAPVIDALFPLKKEDMSAARAQLTPLFSTYDPESGVRDIGVFLEYLATETQARPGKIGLSGYCMGGGIAVRAAARYSDRVAAAAGFHSGRLVTDAPSSAHLLLSSVKARLYFGFADADESMPLEQIAAFEKALRESGVKYESEVYAGAAHGYTMADLPAYNASALEKHWRKLFELFHDEL